MAMQREPLDIKPPGEEVASKVIPNVEIKEAKQPEDLKPEEERDIQETVNAAVKNLEEAKDSQLEELTDSLANIGYKALDRVSTSTKAEQETLGRLVDENDKLDTVVHGEIEKLDDILQKFARDGAKEDPLIRFIGRLPLVGKRVAKWARAEGRKRKTIAAFAQSVETRLRIGRDD